MKKLLLIPIIGLWAFAAQAQVTNLNLSIPVDQTLFQQLKFATDILNYERTNAVPPLVALNPREALSNMVFLTVQAFVADAEHKAKQIVVHKFLDATPQKQAQVLNVLK